MEHVETDDVRAGWQDFEWIADLYKSPCFTTCETSKPATSSDFGCDGLTASLTDWHELLQVTAPDVNCGLVFVRGRFPNAPGAILARAQKPNYRGSKDLFGTRSVRAELDSDLELGQKKAQGWVNFRWPYVHYELKRKGDDSDSSGTYEQISFVRKGTLLQVTRIKWGHGSSLSDYGPDDAPDKQTIRIRSGGRIRFGCPCSNRLVPDVDSYDLNVVNHDDTRLNCVSKKYQKRLEMQVVINGSPQNLRPRRQPAIQDGAETIDMSSIHQVELSVGEPTYIVSALALREENDLSNPIDGGHFEHVQDYLGVERASLNMTDRLWTALCSTNYEAGEAVEFSAVGRCVEQIIGVASIPFSRQSLMQSIFNSQVGKVRDDAGGIVKEIALVQNIMAPQFVDVQSAFYQIRLLTKVYNFISTKHLEPDILEHMQPLDSIRVSYLQMLRHVLLSTVVWLVNTNFRRSRLLPAIKSWDATSQSPASIERLEACENHRVHMTFDQSYNRSCYATLAVWYVMRHCPDAITEKFKNSVLLPSLYNAFQSVQERATRGTEPTPKNDTLQWYHMSCLYLICCQQFGVDEQGNPMDAFALRPGELDRQEILYMQRRFQKFASRLKAGHDGNYSARHEELDRVILLGEELGLQDIHDSPTTFSQATSRAQQTRRRIIERKRTTRFNPGHGPARHLTHTSNGPWELLCTNHEIYLQVAEEMSVTSARNRTFEFLTSDYSFVSSWDCSDSDWISKWWNVETASIVCATLLHLRDEGMTIAVFFNSPDPTFGCSVFGHL
ncbi:hypothetical protein BJ170DRAFT_192465 [Xylariales sp. AK1849]|nr:hypothetical protein BJ170DRAFT_192465 [Xylariales sp. AK1849]